jgi:catalase
MRQPTRILSLTLLGFAVSSLSLASPLLAAEAANDKPVVEQIVDVQTTLAKGPYKGFRANHAKGILATGTFSPSTTAASLSKAAHLQKTATPVTVRFSNATGVPAIPDADPNANPRGIAIRFALPDGSYTDIVSISVNAFPVTTPEEFLGLLNAIASTAPDSAKPTPIEQFLGSHPAALKFVQIPKPAPVSYTTLSYFGVNAFQFTNTKGEQRFGRYRITPLAGEQAMSQEALSKAGGNYLSDELSARLASGEAKFRIAVQLAESGDVIDDATAVWPDNRPQVELGILTLNAVMADSAAVEKTLAFNPLILTDGIAPSKDPILLARPAAYAVSVGRRFSN